MGYTDFLRIADILETNKRLREFAKYYNDKKISGLHYTNFYADTNVISICKPDHSTHHEATSFLLQCKNEGFSINSVRNYGYHLKKFLDYLMLWDMSILDGDLLIILVHFVDYLRLIETNSSDNYPLPVRAIEWASLTYLPLHKEARTAGKISSISMDEYGIRKQDEWGNLSSDYVSKILSVTIRYFIFLKKRTNEYNYLPLGDIPAKEKYKNTFLSGTLGKVKVSIFDIKSILEIADYKLKQSKKRFQPLKERIPTVSEMNLFFETLPSNKRQNKFLFHVLKCFGIRESEAANLMLDTSTLQNNLLRLDYFEAIEYLKKNLRGDIEFNKSIDKWVCKVINRNTSDSTFNSRNKSTEDRIVPLFFSQDEFSMLFLDALKERELVMKRARCEHSYIFISRASSRVGERISGKSVYEKLKYSLKKYFDKDSVLLDMTPHTLRHYFATYCLRILKLPLEDVQRHLGHSDKEITRSIYIHYLNSNTEEPEDIVRDMSDTYRNATRG